MCGSMIFRKKKSNWDFYITIKIVLNCLFRKGKAISLQAWTGPEGSRRLRLPDFKIIGTLGGKVVSSTRRQPLPLGKYSWYSFLLESESTPGS
jgi:hypothetical protein